MPIPTEIGEKIKKSYKVSRTEPAAMYVAGVLVERCADYLELHGTRGGFQSNLVEITVLITLAVDEAKWLSETPEQFLTRLNKLISTRWKKKADLSVVPNNTT